MMLALMLWTLLRSPSFFLFSSVELVDIFIFDNSGVGCNFLTKEFSAIVSKSYFLL